MICSTDNKFKKAIKWMVGPALMVLLSGCYVPHEAATVEDGKKVYEQDPLPYFDTDYQISPGDRLEVTYHVDVEQKDRYEIAIGDQIRIEFYHYPQMDRTLNVRPDGRVTVPYKGDIMAAGRTPMELSAAVNEIYSDFLTMPQSTVSLIRYGAKIRELKEAIRTAPRGQSREAVVQSDGTVSLPLLSAIKVAGKSINQASDAINLEYEKSVPGMFTSTAILQATGNRVYVFGAVQRPGFYQLNGPTSVLQSVALAGGFADFGEAGSTLLISRDEFNRPVGRLVDLASVLSSGNSGQDYFVRQSDVVFVPTTTLGRAALVGDAIRRMIPVNLGFTYTLDDTVDLIGPNQ
ncbi:MAG: polysaccharide biosynthesis/export family protein [Oceanospirillaceae bacterium]|nr:polysaccharide biosynthesis/export family protein [Oceanospirillaceae bacterium]